MKTEGHDGQLTVTVPYVSSGTTEDYIEAAGNLPGPGVTL